MMIHIPKTVKIQKYFTKNNYFGSKHIHNFYFMQIRVGAPPGLLGQNTFIISTSCRFQRYTKAYPRQNTFIISTSCRLNVKEITCGRSKHIHNFYFMQILKAQSIKSRQNTFIISTSCRYYKPLRAVFRQNTFIISTSCRQDSDLHFCECQNTFIISTSCRQN